MPPGRPPPTAPAAITAWSKTRRPDDATCQQCHQPLPEGIEALRASLLADPQQKSGIAEVMLKSRNLNPGTYAVGDIPDKVVIKDLVR